MTVVFALAAAARRSMGAALVPVLASFSFNSLIGVLAIHAIGLGNDAQLYDDTARSTLSFWREGASSRPAELEDRQGYIVALAAMYGAFGTTPYPMIILNAAAVASTALVLAHSTKMLGGGTAAVRLALWSGMFVPGLLLWTKDLIREPFIFLFTALAGMAALRCALKLRWGAWAAIAFLGLAGTRQESVVTLGIAIVMALIFARRDTLDRRFFVLAVSAVLITPVLSYVWAQLPSSDLQSSRVAVARGTTSIASSSTLPVDPLNFGRALLGPLPWEWTGPLLVLALDAVFCWIVLFCAIRWLRHHPSPGLWVLFVPAMALYVVVSITAAYNYGLLIRIRTQPLMLLLPLAFAGLAGPKAASYVWPESTKSVTTELGGRRRRSSYLPNRAKH
ncbi:hypothetical protein [Serinicoccus profundi]|uniref:hypothetical protein n=1 Tax=Serinicoccus profundi TaxID=1078471 RepID=UPI0011479605|nr:hypothetical protein [Serinicoccus profundi]